MGREGGVCKEGRKKEGQSQICHHGLQHCPGAKEEPRGGDRTIGSLGLQTWALLVSPDAMEGVGWQREHCLMNISQRK